MYKFIIGNVRITVDDDDITHGQAIQAARQAIQAASGEGKLLSHIELSRTEDGIDAATTERVGSKLLRKSLRQSMLDAVLSAAQEKLNPTDTYTNKDAWYDGDTGQEWHGGEVASLREALIAKLEEWVKET